MQILRNRKKIRSIQLRKNRNFRFFRQNNVETIVAFQMKNISNSKCRNCVNKNEIFKKYIVVKNCFRKICVLCHYNNENVHCNLHVKSSKYEFVFFLKNLLMIEKSQKKSKKTKKKNDRKNRENR